jgi:hypothetical protein
MSSLLAPFSSYKWLLVRVNGKTCCIEHFPKGGTHTDWVIDPSTKESSEEEVCKKPYYSPSNWDQEYRSS